MSQYRRPYVESSVLIAWIKGETKDGDDVKQIFDTIVDAAAEGQFRIVTSTLTIAEVFKKKGDAKMGIAYAELTDEENASLLPHFREEYIDLVELDRFIAENANELCRTHKSDGQTVPALRPNDAIHVAAAEAAGCDVILSYDAHLLNQTELKLPVQRPEAVTKEEVRKELEAIQEMLALPPGDEEQN